MKRVLPLFFLLGFLALPLVSHSAELKFKRIVLDEKFRSEGAAIGDYNNDGQNDIGVGDLYYAAPDWRPVAFTTEIREFPPTFYSQYFGAGCADVNKDGLDDFLMLPWPGKAMFWFENPGKDVKEGTVWKQYKITDVLNNESPVIADIDKDGLPEVIGGWSPDANNTNGPEKRVCIFKANADPKQPWTRIDVSPNNHPAAGHYSHGFGVGDLNGDGLNDIITPWGYFIQPKEGLSSKSPWDYVASDFGPACAHMQINDFDGDGDVEVFTTSAHNFGVWFFKKDDSGKWVRNEIDAINSQTHATVMVDMNGDGKMDIVTGKRWKAHNGGDPGTDLAAELVWYENASTPGNIKFVRHVIDDNSGVATQFDVADINNDGLYDVAISNKKGVIIFIQQK